MASSSITKDFYVKDPKALERLKKVLEEAPEKREASEELLELEKGRERVRTFVFR